MNGETATQIQNVTRNVIGESAQMQAIFRSVRLVAPTEATVLITGETGVGKEVIAQAIHNNSPRKNEPFKVINCGHFHQNSFKANSLDMKQGLLPLLLGSIAVYLNKRTVEPCS